MGDPVQVFNSQRQRPAEDNCGTEFFRLIQVICMSKSMVSPDTIPNINVSDLPEHAHREVRLLELNGELLKFVYPCFDLSSFLLVVQQDMHGIPGTWHSHE
jgi:hypothetical protein